MSDRFSDKYSDWNYASQISQYIYPLIEKDENGPVFGGMHNGNSLYKHVLTRNYSPLVLDTPYPLFNMGYSGGALRIKKNGVYLAYYNVELSPEYFPDFEKLPLTDTPYSSVILLNNVPVRDSISRGISCSKYGISSNVITTLRLQKDDILNLAAASPHNFAVNYPIYGQLILSLISSKLPDDFYDTYDYSG